MSEAQPHESESPRRVGRGVFLVTVAGGLSSLAWGKSVWSHVSSALGGAEALVPLVPTKGWRIYTVASTMPKFDPATWKLGVGGLVEQPLSLDYGELRKLPRASQVSDFHCVTGWTVKNVHWSGVRIKDLLAQAKPLPKAHGIQFVSAEAPYVDYLTLQQARLSDVMLAYEMDGEPLPREHGAPLRLVIPDMYGYKNVKWVSEVNLVPKAESGYWEQLGYDRDAWVGRSNGY
ncbi:MAG TPA: molybdopterin-dependent oxidoreductase [Gaiellaceae bacterium]|nr:molybdopterin-dependent oxidoreductase [Gaiellaceae bacterium]